MEEQDDKKWIKKTQINLLFDRFTEVIIDKNLEHMQPLIDTTETEIGMLTVDSVPDTSKFIEKVNILLRRIELFTENISVDLLDSLPAITEDITETKKNLLN